MCNLAQPKVRRNADRSVVRAETSRSPLESLEQRRLFSVTVTEGFTGYYSVQGDDAADVIDVSVSMASESFTLGGVTYTGVQFIDVSGGGGNDSITVISDGAGSIGATLSGGDGNDSLLLSFDGGIWGDDGMDTITLCDAFRGQVSGGEGSDLITVGGECVDAVIDGGGGDDGIDASGNNYGVLIHGGAGDDVIWGSGHDDDVYGDGGVDMIYGLGGDDVIYVQDAGGADWVSGGDGYDVLYGNMSDMILDDSVEVICRS